VVRGKQDAWILLEGVRLVQDALLAGSQISAILVREDRQEELQALQAPSSEAFAVAPALYDRLGSVKNPPPVMALARPPRPFAWQDLPRHADPLVLVVAGVADPGNFGALARSAEAAGARALIRVGPGVQPFHPKALRGSMGSLLRLPVLVEASAEKAQTELEGLGFRQACAATRGGQAPNSMDWSGPLALWVTGETGEQPAVMDGMIGVTIPLAHGVESLNVTVAASLLLFAAGRVAGLQHHD